MLYYLIVYLRITRLVKVSLKLREQLLFILNGIGKCYNTVLYQLTIKFVFFKYT